MEAAIKVENLSYSYNRGKEAVKGVSFSIEKGSYVCLIGHNGSGKSTLAKLLLGLLGGYSGKIEILGEELSRSTVHSIRSKVGIVFQNPDNQFVGSTVADDLAFGLENKQVPSEQMEGIIQDVAKQVGMESFLDHEPQMLSGGQKQRVAIAGVIAMKPEIVIFDEATAMLDPKGKKEIRDLTMKMKRENPDITIVSITHDVEEAYQADQVIVLNDGELYLSGSPEEVFSRGEDLAKIRLGLPFIVELKQKLKARGIKIPASVKTLEQLEAFLW